MVEQRLANLIKSVLLSESLSEYQQNFAELKHAVHKMGFEHPVASHLWHNVFSSHPVINIKREGDIKLINKSLAEALTKLGQLDLPPNIDPDLVPYYYYIKEKMGGKADSKALSSAFLIAMYHQGGTRLTTAETILEDLCGYDLLEKKGKTYSLK